MPCILISFRATINLSFLLIHSFIYLFFFNFFWNFFFFFFFFFEVLRCLISISARFVYTPPPCSRCGHEICQRSTCNPAIFVWFIYSVFLFLFFFFFFVFNLWSSEQREELANLWRIASWWLYDRKTCLDHLLMILSESVSVCADVFACLCQVGGYGHFKKIFCYGCFCFVLFCFGLHRQRRGKWKERH